MAYATTDHIKNAAAKAFIGNIRAKYCGLTKTYGSRYMRQLEDVCGYVGGATANGYIVTIGNTQKEFKAAKEAGLFMEAKINDLFDLGIKV